MLVSMAQLDFKHLLISEAVAMRAHRFFLRVAQTTPFAFPGKFDSYRDLHNKVINRFRKALIKTHESMIP
jgi:hypothetical protein